MKFFTNANKKKDRSTNLNCSRGIKDMGGVEKLEVIEKKTQTQAICLPQQLWT